MTVRISVDNLGDEVRKCLERGEAVEIERDGEVVGRLEPGKPHGTLGKLVEELVKLGPPDDEFAKDLEEIRSARNTPIGPTPWES